MAHGMFSLLPSWPSAIGGNKVIGEELKMLGPSGCAPGVNSISLPPMLKRKRSHSSTTDAPAATKIRSEDPVAFSSQPTPSPTVASVSDSPASPVAHSPSVATARPPAQAASGKPDVNRLRETVTAQISLEVLLKHNELRLIDQEIAKCQVALEQLRRCSEIPYPGSAVTGVSADVSFGSGASLLQPGNGPAALSPAPWGVTEGPYSRHYARWLLPDPRFDGGEVESGLSATAAGLPLVEGRSTRGNPIDFSVLAGKTRPSRNSTGAKLQALPSGYPVVKEKAGPMIVRRKSDQVLVKLVCLDCRRDNFSSTQGFINHCRIAHNRSFASHDAAAMASGEPVEVDEGGTVVGGRSESTSSVATPGYVHPLIRSAQIPTSSHTIPTPSKGAVTPRKQSEAVSAAVATPPATVQPTRSPHRRSEPVKPTVNPSFMPSPATPHLSALMRDRGLGLDMSKLVEDSKTPVDLSGLSGDESDGEVSGQATGRNSQGHYQPPTPGTRQPMRMPTAQTASERTESRKGLERATHVPQLPHEVTPTRPQPHQQSNIAEFSPPRPFHPSLADTTHEEEGIDHAVNLSPSMIEANQAPSLVSDDEDDYEAASDSDSPSSSEAGDQDQHFRHIEVEDDERTTAPSAAAEPKPGPSLASPAPQPAPTLSKPLKKSRSKNISMMQPFSDHGQDKHVNYVRPAEDPSHQRNPRRNPSPTQ
ncbi:hypothetical protein PENDEC_c002G00980 [Penicillium decumbens]|uniref:AHC1-like C2H2 zinc-finger domain-containing protein n=1 Tax=Penicillium decumbens TaxID=69771 RepID=A0A1V6PM90_PENDC|nr:hypothetical protein PENDEC_c002G00980 [Penicillium decumbens]